MLEFFSEDGRRRVVLFEIDELIESEQLGLRKANEIALGRKTTMEYGETQQRESSHNIASALQGHRLRRHGHCSRHNVVPPVEKSNGMAGRISPSDAPKSINPIAHHQNLSPHILLRPPFYQADERQIGLSIVATAPRERSAALTARS